MDPNSSNPKPPSLEPALRRLRTRIRRLLFTRGALITTVTALAGLLGLALVDFSLSPLPTSLRWLLPVVWLGSIAYAAFTSWWTPLRRPLDLVRIARWLETRHPELDERISTVLEVSRHGDSGMSSQLLDELAKSAATSLDQINPDVEVSNRRTRRWLWPAAALLLVWGLLFALWPDPTKRHIVRALVPTSTLGNAAGRITVTPGSIELIESDPLEITAHHSAGRDTALEIIIHFPDGSSTAMPMVSTDGGSIYQLGRAERSFEYQIRSGRDTSDRFQVTVWPEPRLVDPRVRLEFPAYTGRAASEQALSDGITAIVGTKVELRSKLNTPVKALRLEIDQEVFGNTQLAAAADGGTFTSNWTLQNPGHSTARIVLEHRLGREFEGAVFTIDSLGDQAPEVKWLGTNDKPLRLRPDDRLDMGFEATDDVGLGSVALEVQPDRGDTARLPVDIPPRFGRGEPPVWRGRIDQAVGELLARWPRCRGFKLRMRVEDSRPAERDGPGVGTSEWIVVRIDRAAPSLARQELSAAHSDARETLEKARQLVEKAEQQIDHRKEEIREAKVSEPARKNLEQAREDLAEARESLEELADRMEESVHADKAEAVRQVAKTAEEARQQLENAPLQDTPEAREKSATDARESAAEAKRELEKLRDEIQSKEPQIQDLAQLKELEQQQRELARQAQAATTAEPSEKWQQEQARMEEDLRQELHQQAQAKAAALEQQAEQAKELAAEAREQAAGQEAQQAPATPEALLEQLAQEQEGIAAETRQQLSDARERQDQATANALPEAVESAEHASEALAKNDAASAANEAKQAADQLSEAAGSDALDPAKPSTAAAELSDLADRQQQIAEALTALENGDTAEAAATLSEMRAEQAAELAEAIRDTPQVNGQSGQMNQAAQSSDNAAQQSNQAARSEAAGKPSEASAEHGKAAQQLEQAASQLDQAAAEFSRQAEQAAGQQTNPQQAPAPAAALAEAFHEAAQAAKASGQSAAAEHAQAAADALAQAADGAMRAMQGQAPGKPGPPGQQRPVAQAGQPGEQADESLRTAEPDPGVPPELAKLGISAEDWEKIKASLKSDVGASSAAALPEEYRDLVRRYFEEISKGSSR